MEQRRSSASTPRQPGMLSSLEAATARLKGNIIALQYAVRDPRTPWYAKVVVGCVVAYAVSPIDLIPDVIPILGYLDDLLLVPLGIYLALKLISPEVLADGRAKAAMDATARRSWGAAVFIVLIWVAALALTAYWLRDFFLARAGKPDSAFVNKLPMHSSTTTMRIKLVFQRLERA